MDITPIFELRSRLRAAMIVGTNLLAEDFRLKKATESFAALSGSSPVFAKINAMTEKLLSENSPECLLDTITLVDAVITTLGIAEVKGEIEPLPDNGCSAIIVNAPYSRLSAVINALISSGGGQYNTVTAAWKETPKIFNDYRVRPALVKGLGASYAELADTAADILKETGKDVIPLLKRDFDPKGKKEMVRRLNIIEELCGAEENDFYLEQLENAEKDVRKALIYLLRHDEKNIGKLIELVKTEKGKAKTAALAALVSFDCKQTEEFFAEYAKKKPVEVIDILHRASSDWTSRLAARLIGELLVDDKGNKITLSQAAETSKVRLKAKTDFWAFNSALWGKYGEDIENIYREFRCEKNTPIAVGMDMRLEETILATNDEGLKALAMELNNAPETKGIYAGAEAAARFLSKEDSTDWLVKQITEEYTERKKSKQMLDNSGILKILRKIFFKDGKYYLTNACYDPINDKWLINEPRGILQPLKGAVSDALMNCSCWEYARILGDWIDENDKEYCQKLGNYFSTLSSTIISIGFLLGYIAKCGIANIKGILVRECKIHTSGTTATVRWLTTNLPGSKEYRLTEVRELIELLRSGKLVMKNVDIEALSAWAESGMN